MARLIVALLIVAIVVIAVSSLAAVVRPVQSATTAGIHAARRGAQVPDSFQKIAYVLLLVLMIGVASGWLGGS